MAGPALAVMAERSSCRDASCPPEARAVRQIAQMVLAASLTMALTFTLVGIGQYD